MLNATLAITCYNEAASAQEWCQSFLAQSAIPAELVIVDSCSTDDTVAILRRCLSGYAGAIKLKQIRCGISRGRNIAIGLASHDLVLITDFGVILDPDWSRQIYAGLADAAWVGGNFCMRGGNRVSLAYATLFDKKYTKKKPLLQPSSRSFGIRKSVWSSSGGYNEDYKFGEDTEFVHRLALQKYSYHFCERAIVYWTPRQTFRALWKQHYNYAYWDAMIGQNNGRSLNVLFVLVLLLAVVFIASYPFFFVVSFLMSVAILTVKTQLNKWRTQPGIASFVEILVYSTVFVAAGIGFARGYLKRLSARS